MKNCKTSFAIALLALMFAPAICFSKAFYECSMMEPINKLHNHGSCVVELPNGDILGSWYKGQGERSDDAVRIVGARLSKGEKAWSPFFEMADFEGFPDCNSAMFVDRDKKLWLVWPLIVANRWETAILMSRYSSQYNAGGGPVWDWQMPILMKPGDEFAEEVNKALDVMRQTLDPEVLKKHEKDLDTLKKDASDPYTRRMGWMPRSKATILKSGRIALPLYSDGFSFGLVALSDDNGKSWITSKPIVTVGGIQPSIVEKKDGTLTAYMRDNGPEPKRIIYSISTDQGMSWTMGQDTDLPDPGAGVEAVALANGHWLMVNNDTVEGRHSMAARISEDEGKSWKYMRHLELWEKEKGAASYPSFICGSDGSIHGSYTYTNKTDNPGETIKYVHFNEDWVKQGD